MCTTLEEGWKHLVEKRLDEICRQHASDSALSSVQYESLRIAFGAACNEYLDAFLNLLRHCTDIESVVNKEIDKRWPRVSEKELMDKYYPSSIPR
jgi:hypothetical protein